LPKICAISLLHQHAVRKAYNFLVASGVSVSFLLHFEPTDTVTAGCYCGMPFVAKGLGCCTNVSSFCTIILGPILPTGLVTGDGDNARRL